MIKHTLYKHLCAIKGELKIDICVVQIDSPVTMLTMEDKRSKSIEEREEEYNKARHRIFNQDVSWISFN